MSQEISDVVKGEGNSPTPGKSPGKYLLAALYILPLLTYTSGLLQVMAMVMILFILMILFFYDDFYLALPILIFFYMQLILPGGIVLFRVYSLLLILKVLKKPIALDLNSLLPFLVITLFCVVCIFPHNIRLGLFIIFDVIFLLYYIKVYLSQKKKFLRFFKYYVLAALSASAFGLLRMTGQLDTAVYVDGNWVFVTRFIATYNDPNYMGFFFNIAIFCLMALPLFRRPHIKWILLGLLYLALIATLSTTAILCNIGGGFIYLILSGKINLKTAVSVLLISQLILFTYNMALERSIPVISNAAMKVKSRILEMDQGNFSSFSSERSDIWEAHLHKFRNQSNLKVFFGGNVITAYIYDETEFETVSHQELIDMLLNFGLLGTGIMMFSFFGRSAKVLRRLLRKKQDDEEEVAILLIKYVWIFYAFGLTMFPGWMFYLFFFL